MEIRNYGGDERRDVAANCANEISSIRGMNQREKERKKKEKKWVRDRNKWQK